MNSHQNNSVPIWASWLGIIIVVMGVYLSASYGNQLMKYWVLDGVPSVEKAEYQYKCPEDELAEEGITLEMCKQKTANVDTILLSIPEWFRSFQIGLMSIGTVLAFVSIFIGVSLIEYKSFSPLATTINISLLFLVDIAAFIAVIVTGPLTRQLYLGDILLWCFIHAILLAAVIAGKNSLSTAKNSNVIQT